MPSVFMAQISLNIECYTNGDTISTVELQKILGKESVGFYFLNDKKPLDDMRVQSWEMELKYKEGRSVTCYPVTLTSSVLTAEMKKKMIGTNALVPEKIIFRAIRINGTIGGEKISRVMFDQVFYRAKKTYKKCNYDAINKKNKVDYYGKFLLGEKVKEPLSNQKVILKDSLGTEIQSAVTDKYGDFTFKNIDIDKSYKIEIQPNGNEIKDGQLFIAHQDGAIIEKINKLKSLYLYDLGSNKLTKLAFEKKENADLIVNKFVKSADNQVVIKEDIFYSLNSAEILPESSVILDKLVDAMIQNKMLKLNIASFTDSNGEDDFNMDLSEKRAQNVVNYMIKKTIAPNRLIGKGFGESQILNRCKNNIDCSEKEHMLNRRTEFTFIK